MAQNSRSKKIEKIINMGTLYQPSENPIISDNHLDSIISNLIDCSREDPGIILTELYSNIESHVAMIGLAILSAAGPGEFLTDRNVRSAAIDILLQKNPIQMLEFIEYLKSKLFGRGFGSRPQKWVREVMESWSLDTLNRYINSCPDELYDLIKLTHPRYKGERGILISSFLKTKS